MILATLKIMVLVLPVCMRLPFRTSHMASFCGRGISSRVTSQGPIGPKVRSPFTLVPLTATLQLELAFADIVDDTVTRHMVQRGLLRHMACLFSNDDAQFDLPIALDRALGQH